MNLFVPIKARKYASMGHWCCVCVLGLGLPGVRNWSKLICCKTDRGPPRKIQMEFLKHTHPFVARLLLSETLENDTFLVPKSVTKSGSTTGGKRLFPNLLKAPARRPKSVFLGHDALLCPPPPPTHYCPKCPECAACKMCRSVAQYARCVCVCVCVCVFGACCQVHNLQYAYSGAMAVLYAYTLGRTIHSIILATCDGPAFIVDIFVVQHDSWNLPSGAFGTNGNIGSCH